MNELKIYYDIGKTKEVQDIIEFKPVISGENTKKSLFFHNVIKFSIKANISVEEKDMEIIQNIYEIKPDETKELILNVNPKITRMKPILAKLNINLKYLVI